MNASTAAIGSPGQHHFILFNSNRSERFRQTPAQAFRAFADPELKQRWFGVPEGWTDGNWELDFRVGGSEVSVGRDPRGTLHEFRSRYHDIVDGERIVFAYDLLLDGRLISVSLTTVEVRPDGGGTRATSSSSTSSIPSPVFAEMLRTDSGDSPSSSPISWESGTRSSATTGRMPAPPSSARGTCAGPSQ